MPRAPPVLHRARPILTPLSPLALLWASLYTDGQARQFNAAETADLLDDSGLEVNYRANIRSENREWHALAATGASAEADSAAGSRSDRGSNGGSGCGGGGSGGGAVGEGGGEGDEGGKGGDGGEGDGVSAARMSHRDPALAPLLRGGSASAWVASLLGCDSLQAPDELELDDAALDAAMEEYRREIDGEAEAAPAAAPAAASAAATPAAEPLTAPSSLPPPSQQHAPQETAPSPLPHNPSPPAAANAPPAGATPAAPLGEGATEAEDVGPTNKKTAASAAL